MNGEMVTLCKLSISWQDGKGENNLKYKNCLPGPEDLALIKKCMAKEGAHTIVKLKKEGKKPWVEGVKDFDFSFIETCDGKVYRYR